MSWDDYVARIRKPSPDHPGISALEFLDRYDKLQQTRYDPQTGGLYQYVETQEIPGEPVEFNGKTYISDSKDLIKVYLDKKEIEEMAITMYYYGPIPLPKNMSVNYPEAKTSLIT